MVPDEGELLSPEHERKVIEVDIFRGNIVVSSEIWKNMHE